jgi:hypothetical protein
MTQETTNIIILLIPLAIGGIIAAINANELNNTTENAEAWVRNTQSKVAKKNGWFSRYIANPILWIVVKFSDWTDDFTHRGLKNGTRVAATLYLIQLWLYLLFAAFVLIASIAIGVLVIYIVLKVLANSDSNVKEGFDRGRNMFQSSNKNDAIKNVGLRGQKIYSGNSWLNEDLTGRVDKDGNIYSGTNWLREEKIGRIDKDGTIYQGSSFLNEEKVGTINEDGTIRKGSNWFNEEKVGRIDQDGTIHSGTSWFNEEKTGRTGN